MQSPASSSRERRWTSPREQPRTTENDRRAYVVAARHRAAALRSSMGSRGSIGSEEDSPRPHRVPTMLQLELQRIALKKDVDRHIAAALASVEAARQHLHGQVDRSVDDHVAAILELDAVALPAAVDVVQEQVASPSESRLDDDAAVRTAQRLLHLCTLLEDIGPPSAQLKLAEHGGKCVWLPGFLSSRRSPTK